MLASSAKVYSQAGRPTESIAAYERLFELLESEGGPRSIAIDHLLDFANELSCQQQPERALATVQRAQRMLASCSPRLNAGKAKQLSLDLSYIVWA